MGAFGGFAGIRNLSFDARPCVSSWRLVAVAAAVAACLAVCAQSTTAATIPQSTLVNFDTSMGSFQVDLYDSLLHKTDPLDPDTVANFLSYVTSSAYSNSVIHRLQKAPTQGIGIVQGGGFTPGADVNQFNPITLPGHDPIKLQYRMDNAAGTLAMARTGDPNSATASWFFNAVDNTADLGPKPGSDGYAVFGHVMAGGMPVVTGIYNLPVVNSSVSTDFPLRNWSPGQQATEANYVYVNSVTVAKTHAAFTNPNILLDVNNDGIISPADAVSVINNLALNHGIHPSSTYIDTKYRYVDTTADGLISPADAVKVINYLILHQGQAVSHSLAFSTPSLTVSAPEPSSWIAGAIGGAALAVVAWRRRRICRA